MGHSLLHWDSYAYTSLKPVSYNSLFLLLPFLNELNSTHWLCWLLSSVLGLFIFSTLELPQVKATVFVSLGSWHFTVKLHVDAKSIPKFYQRRRGKRPNRKYARPFCRRRLQYWLVRRCCRCKFRHRPPCLDGSFFPSPHCNRVRRWKRRRVRARAFFKRRQMDKFLSGCNDRFRPWILQGASATARDSFCASGDLDFLKLQ